MRVYTTQVRWWFEDSFGFFYGDLTKQQLKEQMDFDVEVCMEIGILPCHKWGIFSTLTTYEDGTEEFVQF